MIIIIIIIINLGVELSVWRIAIEILFFISKGMVGKESLYSGGWIYESSSWTAMTTSLHCTVQPSAAEPRANSRS